MTASRNGWFNVRFIPTDTAENIPEQILSPAFKIENSEGIEPTVSPEITVSLSNGTVAVWGCESPVIDIYSLDGILLGHAVSYCIDALDFSYAIYFVK